MIKGLNHLTFAVRDLERSFRFYAGVLGFQPLARWDEGAYLLAGNLWVALALDDQTRQDALPEYTHVAFDVAPNDFGPMSLRIIASGATVWRENQSEGASLYFLDPDGHKLEIHASDWQSRVQAMEAHPKPGWKRF